MPKGASGDRPLVANDDSALLADFRVFVKLRDRIVDTVAELDAARAELIAEGLSEEEAISHERMIYGDVRADLNELDLVLAKTNGWKSFQKRWVNYNERDPRLASAAITVAAVLSDEEVRSQRLTYDALWYGYQRVLRTSITGLLALRDGVPSSKFQTKHDEAVRHLQDWFSRAWTWKNVEDSAVAAQKTADDLVGTILDLNSGTVGDARRRLARSLKPAQKPGDHAPGTAAWKLAQLQNMKGQEDAARAAAETRKRLGLRLHATHSPLGTLAAHGWPDVPDEPGS